MAIGSDELRQPSRSEGAGLQEGLDFPSFWQRREPALDETVSRKRRFDLRNLKAVPQNDSEWNFVIWQQLAISLKRWRDELATFSITDSAVGEEAWKRREAIATASKLEALALRDALNRARQLRSWAVARTLQLVIFSVLVAALALLSTTSYMSDPAWALLVTFLPVVVLVLAVWAFNTERPESSRGSTTTTAAEQLRMRLSRELDASIRLTLNELAEGKPYVTFTVSDSRELVDSEASETLDNRSYKLLAKFVESHDKSAIGVAGPRGVGKSTLIRRIAASSPKRVGVYLQAPVYYEPSSFVRMIHREVVREYLRSLGIEPSLQRSDRVTALSGPLLGSVYILGGSGLVLYDFIVDSTAALTGRFSSVGLVGVCVSIVGLLTLAAARRPVRYKIRHNAPKPEKRLVKFLSAELNDLEYSKTYSKKSKASTKIAQAIGVDLENQVQEQERESSPVERVAALKSFLRRYHGQEGSLALVVAIDELDKIASPEKAVELINGLKDLFVLDRTHFLLSVSEDALASFALRGVAVRDVFDSSFDDIVRLAHLTSTEAIDLVNGRVVRFPESATLACHALSGGLPRDLLRAARNCVDLRVDPCTLNNREVNVGPLIREVARDQFLAVLDGAARRFSEAEYPTTYRRLLELRSGCSTATFTGRNFVHYIERVHILHDRQLASEDDGSMPAELLAHGLACATVADLTEVLVESPDPKVAVTRTESRHRFDELARQFWSIPSGPLTVIEELIDLGNSIEELRANVPPNKET